MNLKGALTSQRWTWSIWWTSSLTKSSAEGGISERNRGTENKNNCWSYFSLIDCGFLLSGRSILLTMRASLYKIRVSAKKCLPVWRNDSKDAKNDKSYFDRGYFNCYPEESEKPQELTIGGGDTCQGDSGGPLIRSGQKSDIKSPPLIRSKVRSLPPTRSGQKSEVLS